MENYEEDACSELIPDSPRPPIFVDFSAKPTPSEIRNELLSSEEKTDTKSRRSRKPRSSVKALKEGPKKQNTPKGPQPQKALKGGRKRKTPESEEKGPTEEEMLLKVANVLRDAVGFVADKLFKGNGAILKEFQSDVVLSDLIRKDMQKYSPLMGSKAQMVICTGVDVANGYQKRPSQPQSEEPPVKRVSFEDARGKIEDLATKGLSKT